MSRIRLGLIGLGRFAEQHLACLRDLPMYEIAAVCDLDGERSAAVGRELGCPAYTDWRELLAREPLDAVDVLLPEHLHADPVLAALEAGCHVFVEKPLAISSAEAERMIEAAQRAERLLFTGHVCRFDPRYIAVREGAASGAFGRLRTIYARRNNGKRYFDLYRRVNPVFILGIHDIDLMHWLSGSDVEEVYALAPPGAGGGQDALMAMLKFRDGLTGVIENNWLLPDHAPADMDVRMEIVGDEATAQLREPDESLVLWNAHAARAPVPASGAPVYGRAAGPLYAELRHVGECIIAGRPSPILNPGDALRAVAVAEAIAASAVSGKPERPKLNTKEENR
ncbi:Gfo/Idh/MocA family oxidoreductase [Paenibacillus sp. IB182496]|uniref:Gfo/Idh/MocA family oxidoreductase n=1 Tax=Paenibacillus sabuli TaxID=2772509 RepID=A0A927BZM2_9BACL|nr:Gfo/Idh/MocA family oxidoreductase [Paenibacillus sabuli]MBD2848660.1 Gfo/Idh/MocA family oxidoreductase [Paenibacillus sabuli]